jgi:hypothetical protein
MFNDKEATGHCWNCNYPVGSGELYCSKECQEDAQGLPIPATGLSLAGAAAGVLASDSLDGDTELVERIDLMVERLR